MENPESVYWMPPNEPNFILPYRDDFQTATVIKAVKGQRIDQDIYFLLLSKRVQRLIEECEDPEDMMRFTFYILEKASLIDFAPNNVETAGNWFVFDNYKLREHLYLAGVFNEMPKQLNENNSQAEELFNRTDLEGWYDAVTTTVPEDYR